MVEKLFLSLVAGLFGLIPVLINWISERNKSKSRAQQISRLTAELEFLERCIGLSDSIAGESQTTDSKTFRSKIQPHIDRLLAQYASLSESHAKAVVQAAPVSFIRRALLLYRPATGTGWLIHTLFYVIVIFVMAIIVSDFQSPTFDPETGENQFSELLLGLTVIFVPILVLIQRIAERLRKREMANA